MSKCVLIENEMPSYLRCKGLSYEETKHLNMQAVSMFIERDLHYDLKKFPDLKPNFAVSLIKKGDESEIRIHVNVAFWSTSEALQPRIEAILWQYNCQTFIQKQGQLVALPSRFQFEIEITEYSALPQVEENRATEGADHA